MIPCPPDATAAFRRRRWRRAAFYANIGPMMQKAGGKGGRKGLRIALVAAGTLAALALGALTVTRHGLVPPGTGFMIRARAVLSALEPVPYEAVARRAAGEADLDIVASPPRALVDARDLSIEGPGGALPVRLYRAEGAPKGPAPVLLFMHGGGWVQGSVGTYDALCRWLAVESGALVASLEYRLAPEHPYPAAVEDALAAYRWLLSGGAGTDADAARVFVSGDSAGGNLAAVLCLAARETGLPQPAGQILLYPATDLSRTDTESRAKYGSGYLLDAEAMDWFMDQYVPDRAERSDWRVSPLLAPSHAALAPALVYTAEYDALRDEGEAYAAALAADGTRVVLRRVEGQVHGFASTNRFSRAAYRVYREAGAFIREGTLPADR